MPAQRLGDESRVLPAHLQNAGEADVERLPPYLLLPPAPVQGDQPGRTGQDRPHAQEGGPTAGHGFG